MTYKLSGYLRDNPGGAAVSGKTVSLLSIATDLAPTTNTFTTLSSTTDVTDADGYWEFTADLGLEPLYVSAALGGGNVRERRSDEQFLYESWPIQNLPMAFRAFGDGVVERRTPGAAATTDFAVTPSAVRILAISPGYAMIRGYVFGWDSGTKNLTGNANGAAGTTRYDFVCLRQYYAGVNRGRQTIVLVEGGSSTDPVPTTTETDLTKFIRGATIWDLPIKRGQLAFGSALYTVDNLIGVWPYPYAGQHITGSMGNAGVEDLAVNDQLNTIGDVSLRDADFWIDSTGVNVAVPLLFHSYSQSITTTPIVAANAVNTTGAGVGASASISGSDRSGSLTLNMGATPGAGRQLLVTMDVGIPSGNYNIVLIPKELDSINNVGKFRALPVSATQWEINALDTPSSNQHQWGYVVEGY